MSKKINTPESDKVSTNLYITPIKKKRIKAPNEFYINNNNLNRELDIFPNQNQILNSKTNEDNKNDIYFKSKISNSANNTEDKNFITSTYKKCLKSPLSNFLLHSPVSFENYLECFSRKNINVLNLIKKNKCGLNMLKEINLEEENIDLNFTENLNKNNTNNEIKNFFDFSAYEDNNRIDINHNNNEKQTDPDEIFK